MIDVDQVLENGKRLIETARLYGIELYLMTKQFGRNPWLAEKTAGSGLQRHCGGGLQRGASHAPRRFAGSASGASGTNPFVIRFLTPLNREPTSSLCLPSTKRGKFLRQR
ncbi:hypothetical protein DMI65_01250 [Escherichia coli]|nr:hypothetical protein [Escherichia coli]